MSIDPREKEIIGSWTLVNGRMVEDEASRRVRSLAKTELQHIATTKDGWEKLYRDPQDGRYWELFYPRGEMQAGGPPTLRVIGSEQARAKFECEL